jgi:undecaprenyl pyrophosphate phosphatase UppP
MRTTQTREAKAAVALALTPAAILGLITTDLGLSPVMVACTVLTAITVVLGLAFVFVVSHRQRRQNAEWGALHDARMERLARRSTARRAAARRLARVAEGERDR